MSRAGWRFLSAALACAVFLVDVLTPLEGAVAVLYVVAILLAARTARRDDIIAAAVGCVILTIAAYLLSHNLTSVASPALRALVSLAAITITAGLALQNQAATKRLAAQARLLNLSHDMIFVRDRRGVIAFWNKAAEETYGWSAEDAIGKVADDLLRTVYPGRREAIESVLIETGRWEGKVEQQTKAGAVLTVDARWAVQHNHIGKPISVLETHTDVTERRQAQDALLAAQSELAHAARVATLGELTASIAHEVNQPLAAIVTSGEAGLRWLRRDVPNLEEVSAAISRVVTEGRRAGAIVTRIRTFLKKAPAHRDVLQMREIIEEAAQLVERELTKESIILSVATKVDLPPVRGDRVQLQQVLVNLLINAAQAMADQSGPRNITVGVDCPEDGGLAITVTDTGPGIGPDDLAHLFQPFFTTKQGGMGMGLAICRTTVEAHGGQMTAESSPGHGATFRLTLPAIQEPALQ